MKKMKEIQVFNRVRKTIRYYSMLDRGDRVLLCVSGGPDSIFLTYALLYLRKEFNLRLYIAHLDHGIRGKVSYQDLLFVKRLADRFGIRFFSKRIILTKDKAHSVEETARKKRYDLFEKIAKKYAISKIATAHTADDQAETVLMRVLKGASIKGLSGIPPIRICRNASYIRPLIELEKKDILYFLNTNSIAYRTDSTNKEERYFRNVVRNRIIPYLKRYNPQLKRALINIAESLREDKDFIERATGRITKGISKKDGMVFLPLKDIVIQPTAIQKEVVRDALDKAGSNLKKLTFRHWKKIRLLLTSMQNGKSLDMPGNVVLSKKGTALYIRKQRRKGHG